MSSSPTDPTAPTTNGDRAMVLDIVMPQMGVSVAEGTLLQWHKRPGDWVLADETICEISTDKIDTEVPSPAAGRVTELLVQENETVPVGAVLARVATDAVAGEPHPDERGPVAGRLAPPAPASDAPADQVPPSPAAVSGAPADQAPPPPAAVSGAPTGRAPSPRPATSGAPAGPALPPAAASGAPPATPAPAPHVSPVVRRIAEREGVDLAQVTGSGRAGRVRKQDVLAHLRAREDRAANGDAPLPPLHIESPYRDDEGASPDTGEPLSRMRQTIAEHMLRSLRTAAHCTSIMEVDMSAVEAARAALGVTSLAFVARATIDALRAHPVLNATLQDGVLTRHRDVNLGIAVSLGEDGLIVPVIARAQELSVEGLAARIRELARRARARELTPDDVSGGTFTITNPGGFGTLASTPIINQPQVAILDLEAVVKRAVVVTDDRGDSIAIRPMTNLCLSWDHRALDGALAARFLATVRDVLQSGSGRSNT